jgi:hypothetical protein
LEYQLTAGAGSLRITWIGVGFEKIQPSAMVPAAIASASAVLAASSGEAQDQSSMPGDVVTTIFSADDSGFQAVAKRIKGAMQGLAVF